MIDQQHYEKVFLAADHAGFALKDHIKAVLLNGGYEVEDLTPTYLEGDDYPDVIAPLAVRVAEAPKHHRGIIIGLSGQGEAMVANRTATVRAAVYTGGGDEVITLSREHNDANVLSFGAQFVSPAEAARLTLLWLRTGFSGDERHVRRIKKF